jgi:hypothetical protein
MPSESTPSAPQPVEPERLVPISQVAFQLGRSVSSVKRIAALVPVKDPNSLAQRHRLLYRQTDVAAYIASLTKQSA